jgi:formamidopyrimidine-DNA glycosylase
MPELPEVETVCRGLAKELIGHVIHGVALRRATLRFPMPPFIHDLVEGAKVKTITRHSKYALIHLDQGGVIIIHLGMTGRMVFMPYGAEPQKHDHVIFFYGTRTTQKPKQLFFNDARRFGVLDYTTQDVLMEHPLLRHLGIDPFDPDFTPVWLEARLQKRKGPIKQALMDQKLIAGLGNIYVCEALFAARVSPERPANQLTRSEIVALVKGIRKVLLAAIEAGGSSLRDYVQADGNLGYFQTKFKVYGHEGEACSRCKEMIARIVQSGRSSFYCPSCQI